MTSSAELLADELLVMRCQDGDPAAMAALVSRWQRRLWRHALRLTDSPEAAWEVVQEAWLGIVRGIGRLDDAARFGPWAYRIVTNKAADWVRGYQRLRERSRPLTDPGPPAPQGRPDEAQNVRAALDRLPAWQRAILALRYLESFGLAEIAEILAIPVGTVKSRLHTARQELKRLLETHRP